MKPEWDGPALWKVCTNGSSELLTNISMSFVSMLYNYQLITIAGTDGVAAFGVIMYVAFFFEAIFIGYSMGTAPIVSYNYGARRDDELQSIFRKSLTVIAGAGLFLIAKLLACFVTVFFWIACRKEYHYA